MNNNLIKYFNYYIPIIIGTISLIMSYETIVSNTISLGWIAYCLPIAVDCLLIYLSVQSYIFQTQGYKKVSQIAKILTYLMMLGTLFLNNINSVQNNSIQYISLIAHSFIVLAYIICVEFLLIKAKVQYYERLKIINEEEKIRNKKIQHENEIREAQHKLEISKINNQQKIEIDKYNASKEKMDDTNFLLKLDNRLLAKELEDSSNSFDKVGTQINKVIKINKKSTTGNIKKLYNDL